MIRHIFYIIGNRSLQVILLLVLSLSIMACNSVNSSETANNDQQNPHEAEQWLIPPDQIYVGAGKDQIRSIDNPTFSSISEIDFLEENDLVLGMKVGNEIKAYPHNVMNYHEVANDMIGDRPVAVTFCPLTGSGVSWSRKVKNGVTTFGVSGLIYKNNLIAYDRETESRWSQMEVLSVNGPLMGNPPEKIYHGMVEMTWSAWKKAYPNSKVLNGTRLMDWAYDSNPYGEDYPTNNQSIVFPIENEDDRLERKALCHGIYFNTRPLVFPIEKFPAEMTVLNLTHANNEVVVVGNSRIDLAVSYSRTTLNGTTLEFSATDDPLPVIMKDNEGNKWNIFGEAVSGPREGSTLHKIPSYNAYWFAWADFFGGAPREPRIYPLGN